MSLAAANILLLLMRPTEARIIPTNLLQKIPDICKHGCSCADTIRACEDRHKAALCLLDRPNTVRSIGLWFEIDGASCDETTRIPYMLRAVHPCCASKAQHHADSIKPPGVQCNTFQPSQASLSKERSPCSGGPAARDC